MVISNVKTPQQDKAGNGEASLLTKTKILSPSSKNTPRKKSNFDKQVILKQSPTWTIATSATIMGVAVIGLVWASIAKIEQVVQARGQFKPSGQVKELQVPVNGVVEEVYVQEGESVTQGQLLLVLDSTSAQAQLESLAKVRESLSLENQFYRFLMSQSQIQVEEDLVRLKIPPEVASLARNRSVLVAENQLFEAKLSKNVANLDLQQLIRWKAHRAEVRSRLAAARLEIQQLEEQLASNQVKLADARQRLLTEEQILKRIKPLSEVGAIAELQSDRQQQEVQTRKAELETLRIESQRLKFDIEQAEEQLDNTLALTHKDILTQITENEKGIAEIDSQLYKIMVENDKRIAELDSEIRQTEVTLKYQQLKSPVSGTVFDLKAFRGFVLSPSQAEILLKVVPEDNLIAEVFVTNEDIGFVREGMKVDVRIDTFPFSEFGDIKGEVFYVGSDSLPPDENYRFHRFPVKVKLDEQILEVDDRKIQLKPGMSVSANIKVRENRTVLSLFTELFTKKVESLKEVR